MPETIMPTGFTAQGRVLVVDDQQANLRVVSALLARHGYEVVVADNGPAALAMVEAQVPDLILLDMMMPGMDGWTFCKVRQGVLMLKDIPVVAMSAAHVLQHQAPLRVEGLLPKPFEPKQLALLAARMAGRKVFHGPKVT
jgi:two-component system sensor histidine kinase/response regulator